jgi:hypothetical protein
MTRKDGDINGERLGLKTFEKSSILFKTKKGENFNQRNTFSVLRINPPKFGGGLKFETDAGIGKNGAFCKGLLFYSQQPRAIMQIHQG